MFQDTGGLLLLLTIWIATEKYPRKLSIVPIHPTRNQPFSCPVKLYELYVIAIVLTQ